MKHAPESVLAMALREAAPLPGTNAKPTVVEDVTFTAVGIAEVAVSFVKAPVVALSSPSSTFKVGNSPVVHGWGVADGPHSLLRVRLAWARPGISGVSTPTVRTPSSSRTRSSATTSANDCMSRRATRWTPRSTANAAISTSTIEITATIAATAPRSSRFLLTIS